MILLRDQRDILSDCESCRRFWGSFLYTTNGFRHNTYEVLQSGGDVVKYENMEDAYVGHNSQLSERIW